MVILKKLNWQYLTLYIQEWNWSSRNAPGQVLKDFHFSPF